MQNIYNNEIVHELWNVREWQVDMDTLHEMNLIIDSTIGIAKEYFITKNALFMIFDRLLPVLDPKNWEDSNVFMLAGMESHKRALKDSVAYLNRGEWPMITNGIDYNDTQIVAWL